MRVVLSGKTIRLDPRRMVGQGGEAEVFAHGRGRVIKIFKQPDHRDFAADAAVRDAVQRRLDEHQNKLVDFPTNLPGAVIAPIDLVRDERNNRIVGYSMERVANAEPLYALKNPRARRDRGLAAQTEVLVKLRQTLASLHQRGVIIGDFNDLNVLVKGNEPYLIDSDSYQFGAYACPVYSERFLDPRLTNEAGALVSSYSEESDWFAFAAIAVQTLLSVEPYGGVLLASGSAPRTPQARRPRARLSIFNAPVRLPRPALPPEVLSDELREYFERMFASDKREPMTAELLEGLRWRRCTDCGLDHARRRCPHCAPLAAPPPRAAITGATRITDPRRLAALRERLGPATDHWIDGRRLLRRGHLGPEHVGDVLAAATKIWVGETFGIGFYAAGRLSVGFVFDRRRVGINDQVPLPPRAGALAEASCALSTSRAWLAVSEAVGPVLRRRLSVVERQGAIVADVDISDEGWALGMAGACAIGDVLLVPTDSGVVRLEVRGGHVEVTKTFTATSTLVDSATRLVSDGRALYAVGRDHVFELSC